MFEILWSTHHYGSLARVGNNDYIMSTFGKNVGKNKLTKSQNLAQKHKYLYKLTKNQKMWEKCFDTFWNYFYVLFYFIH